MAQVNIPSYVEDSSYRYRMPKLISKKEGAGNGKKTRLVNVEDVSRSLKCPPAYTTKWFGLELGAQSTYEPNAAIVNGWHELGDLCPLLDKFIERYILCPNCKLPELAMTVKSGKAGDIMGKCAACGWKGELDGTHRLAAYIRSHPPAGVAGTAAQGAKLDKAARRERKAAEQRARADEDDDDDDDDEKDKKKKKDKKEKKKKKTRDLDDEDEDEDDDGGKKKKKEKKEKKEKKAKRATRDDLDSAGEDEDEKEDVEKEAVWSIDSEDTAEVVQRIAGWVKDHDPLVPDQFYEEVRLIQIANGFDARIRMYIVVRALFGDDLSGKALAAQKRGIKYFLDHGAIGAPELLYGFESYLHMVPKLDKQYAMVLKALYDEDVVEDEALIAHYTGPPLQHPGYAAAKKFAAPFVEWLQQSDDEDSDSD